MKPTLFFSIVITCLFSCGVSMTYSQSVEQLKIQQNKNQKIDTSFVKVLLAKAQSHLEKGEYREAIRTAEEVITTSDRIKYPEGKAGASIVAGEGERKIKNYQESLKFFVQAKRVYEVINNRAGTAEAHEKIGFLYQEQQIFNQALVNFEKALEWKKSNSNKKDQILLLESIGTCYIQERDYKNAILKYNDLLKLYQSEGTSEQIISTQDILAELNLQQGIVLEDQNSPEYITFYEKSVDYNKTLIEKYKSNNRLVELAKTYNNIGYGYERMDKTKEAQQAFQDALKVLDEKIRTSQGDTKIAAILNAGVVYSRRLRSYQQARKFFNEGYKLAKEAGKPIRMAEANLHNAMNFYYNGTFSLALEEVNNSIELGEKYRRDRNAKTVLKDAYYLKSLLYKETGNYKESEEAKKESEKVSKELSDEFWAAQNALLEKEKELSKKEQEYYDLTVKEAEDAAAEEEAERQRKLIKAELEKAKAELDAQKAKEQAFISERARIEASLGAERQKAEAEKQKAEAERQKAEAERQRQAARNSQLEKEKADAERKKSDAERKAAQQTAELSRRKTQFAYYIGAAIGLALIAAIIAWINTQRKNRKIQQQKREIEQRNNEIVAANTALQEKQEEIQAQNEVLESKNFIITQSINAGLTIQQAILPQKERIQEIFDDYFIFYRPRDIVSGDFYWINQVDELTIVGAIDCTGHGVPGAFMSMIGNTLLDKVILLKRSLDPASILETLNQEVRLALKQDSTQNRDGMDAGLVSLQPIEGSDKIKVMFCGAKRPLYYVEAGDNEVKELKGDRKSIGGEQVEDIYFTNTEIILDKNSCLYLSSDGFCDQNDGGRKKFGSRKLMELIKKYSKAPMLVQGEVMAQAFDEHKKSSPQRDDVLLMGIRL